MSLNKVLEARSVAVIGASRDDKKRGYHAVRALIESKFEGTFVDFPEPEPACFEDASWGPNPNAKGVCPAEGLITS